MGHYSSRGSKFRRFNDHLDDIAAARAKIGPGAPEIQKSRLFYNHPGWARSWAASLSAALQACRAGVARSPRGPQAIVEVLFSAHSIPVSMAETSPYVEHVSETARRLIALSRVMSVAEPAMGKFAYPIEIVHRINCPFHMTGSLRTACSSRSAVSKRT